MLPTIPLKPEKKRPARSLSYADIVKGSLRHFITYPDPPVFSPHSPTKLYTVPSVVFQIPSSSVLFTTEFFQVRKTTHKGYSAFAIRDIEEGTTIITEKPLMKAEIMTVYYEFEKLTKQQQNEYLSLAGWKMLGPRAMAIFKTNRFEITRAIGGIFPRSSRFNHACHPYATCTYTYDGAIDTLMITAIKKICKGDEITISYTSAPSTLPENYGFKCDCPGCCNVNVEDYGDY